MEEYLEIWDFETGKPTGKRVKRSEAHHNAIPHEGVHLWIVRNYGDELEIILQKRAKNKEHFPGYYDISVGGHVPFGYNGCKICKESEEELGILPEKEKLFHIDTYFYEEDIPEMNLYHKEVQNIFLYRDDRNLDEYSFNDGEVEAVAAVKFTDFEMFFYNKIQFAACEIYNGNNISNENISIKELHPLFFTEPMGKYIKNLIEKIKERYIKSAL